MGHWILENAIEPLILDPEDWSEDEWATICKLFGTKVEDTEEIIVRDYYLEIYKRENESRSLKDMEIERGINYELEIDYNKPAPEEYVDFI